MPEPGQIVLSEALVQKLKGTYNLTMEDGFSLKGIAEKIHVYQVALE